MADGYTRKHECGNQKRRKKQKQEQNLNDMRGSLLKYVSAPPRRTENANEELDTHDTGEGTSSRTEIELTEASEEMRQITTPTREEYEEEVNKIAIESERLVSIDTIKIDESLTTVSYSIDPAE